MSGRRFRAHAAARVFALSAVLGCGGEAERAAYDEPLRVENGIFKSGELPGAAPAEGSAAAPPEVTYVASLNNLVRPGQAGKNLAGRASPGALSVALRFADLGTGFWVVPVDAPDPQENFELTWQALVDVGWNAAPGVHPLRVVAIDEGGNAGIQKEIAFCVASSIPDNGHACDPARPLPRAVVSLTWDAAADLDLVVVTPAGKTVDAKHPSTAAASGPAVDKASLSDAATGTLDRDAHAACATDGPPQEDLVFQGDPPGGTYQVYVRMFDACSAPGAHFTLRLFEAVPTDGGDHVLTETVRKRGELTPIDAQGGRTPGLFVTEIPFP